MAEIRALIVDDSSVMRKIVERMLRQAGLAQLVVSKPAAEPRRWNCCVPRRWI